MNLPEQWLPESLRCLRGYSRQDFGADLLAGLTVGLVALPLAMAFGIASGVTPQAGLYTAIVAGGLISALGGSRMQIGGPTGAFVVIVAGIVAKFGVSGLALVTLMAGALLVVMGLTGLGAAVKFIPRPVTIGFTNGIALLIASTQVKDFLGLKTGAVPSAFVPRMTVLIQQIGTMNWPTVAVSVSSLAIVVFLPRVTKRIPGSILAMLGCTVAVASLALPIETIGSKFGGIPTGFPSLSIPIFRFDQVLPLFPSAMTVALLAAVESLLSAVVADSMSGTKHRSNVELVAQGIANIASPLFGGIPATGAIARTATNIRAGARTPLSGVIHAITLLMVLVAAAPLASYIPLATLAAILFVVAYNMGEWREIGTILRLSKADIAVWAVTFTLTVLADLTVAVEVGMVLAALLYIYRISQTTTVVPVTEQYIEDGRPHVLQDKQVPPYVAILRIHGPFLFGTTEKLSEATADLSAFPPVVIVRLRNMTALDATGVHALEVFAKRLQKSGRTLLLCGARDQPALLLQKADFIDHVGRDNILPHVEAALQRAREINEAFGGVGREMANDFERTSL
ncbi:MAG TPA: SulP family inorganic anion transporter [Bryobacteraceae bacterium]|jgi:SulP family sulfate permease|nr:SulP family inorganic anion transporter [Bryobacteraceae bacterium]